MTFLRRMPIFALPALEAHIPHLFAGKNAEDCVRVWVPACATGEEAYALAVLLKEHTDRLDDPPKVQLFATDIDELAITTARKGEYPTVMLEGLSPERRQRFFVRNGATCQVAKAIRDLCTFSTHSLAGDPPLSRIDLISCRNPSIHLDLDLRSKAITAFHAALIPDGVLLLGSFQTVSPDETRFTPLNRRQPIFRRQGDARRALQRPGGSMRQVIPTGKPPKTAPDSRPDWSKAVSLANARVLERFASAFVVVTAAGHVVHFSSRTGRFLEPASGAPTRDVFEMARPGLRMVLRSVLRRAVQEGRTAEQHGIGIESWGGAARMVVITAEPLPGPEPGRLYLVVFSDTPAVTTDGPASTAWPAYMVDLVAQLELENRHLREELQYVSEEHKSAAEELRSSNEELQSSNEELEASKEEILLINEQLSAVNSELSGKVAELDRSHSDLRNLFDSTGVATIFLDRHLAIRGFTPEVGKIYNLIPTDVGRPLTDIVSRLSYTELRVDMQAVLATQAPRERQVSRDDNAAQYLMRILPYRAPDGTVDGTLITFVDVTSIVQAEQYQRLLVDELNHRVKNMLTVVISMASQSVQAADTLEAFSEVFLGRLHALTTAYTLLSRENWSTVPLREVITEELSPFMDAERANVALSGPDIPLDPRSALALGMALHELATNAVKYGALSVPQGRVAVTWDLEQAEDGQHLVFSWIERNGPPVVTPKQKGFGIDLIERGLSYDLSGEARIAFLPDGVQANLRAPFPRENNTAGYDVPTPQGGSKQGQG